MNQPVKHNYQRIDRGLSAFNLAELKNGSDLQFKEIFDFMNKYVVWQATYKYGKGIPTDYIHDAVANSWHKLFINREKMNSLAHIKRFLFKCTKNELITISDTLKKKRTRIKELAYLTREEVETDHDYLPLVNATIEKLLPSYREVLSLQFHKGLTIDEICHFLKKPRQNILNVRTRAINKLIDLLKEHGASRYKFNLYDVNK